MKLSLVFLPFVLASCAQTIASIPQSVTASPHDFSRLKGKTVAVSVLDRRPKQEETADLVARVRGDVAAALKREGVAAADEKATADARLTVRVTYLQADFELGNWVGCTRMSWDLAAGDAPAADPVSVERCVRKSNMWGYQTANDVVDDSYAAAMADFLTKLEIASARLPAPAAQPPL